MRLLLNHSTHCALEDEEEEEEEDDGEDDEPVASEDDLEPKISSSKSNFLLSPSRGAFEAFLPIPCAARVRNPRGGGGKAGEMAPGVGEGEMAPGVGEDGVKNAAARV